MAIYGLDSYGTAVYGPDPANVYSAEPVTASQPDYGRITVTWSTPAGNSWGRLRLVRSPYGFPVTVDDGIVLLEVAPTSPVRSYDDIGLPGGRYFYYTVFLSTTIPAYSAATTYQAGDRAAYNGSNWVCLNNGTLNITPGTGGAWAITFESSLWNRAGSAASLAVADNGYTGRLYDLVPRAYKSSQAEITAVSADNPALAAFLSVFAYQLDTAKTELDDMMRVNDVTTMRQSRLYRLAAQLGVTVETTVSARIQRMRVRDAARIAALKGTPEGIRAAVYAVTGWDSSVAVGPNMMLSQDQSSFASPVFPAWDSQVAYLTNEIVLYNGYQYLALPTTTVQLTPGLAAPTVTVYTQTTSGSYNGFNGYPGLAYILTATASGGTATWTYTPPSTGTYEIGVNLLTGPQNGICNIVINGVVQASVDTYAATTAQLNTARYTVNLTAGANTIGLVCTGTNASSTGNRYNLVAWGLAVTNVAATTTAGAAPTGTKTSNANWQVMYADTTFTYPAMYNPVTGGISTYGPLWDGASTIGSVNTVQVTGLPDPLNQAGNTAKALQVNAGASVSGSTAFVGASSITWAQTPAAYSAATSYLRNTLVTYGGATYISLGSKNSGNQPDVSPAWWAPWVGSTGTTTPDLALIQGYGIPLVQSPVWMPQSQYNTGDLVSYQGRIFQSITSANSTVPPKVPASSPTWVYIGADQAAYTASIYVAPPASAIIGGTTSAWTNFTAHPVLSFYAANGTQMASFGLTQNAASVGQQFYIRFDTPAASSAAMPTMFGYGWSTSGIAGADDWQSSSGVAYPASRNASWGRLLMVNRSIFYGYYALTFISAPPAGWEHGISPWFQDQNNYVVATRTRLIRRVSGTDTVLATWPYIADGNRMVVTMTGTTTITVSVYNPNSAVPTLTTLGTNTGSFSYSGKPAIMERPYP